MARWLPASATLRIVALCVLVALVGLALDLAFPLGIAAGIPYIALVLLGMWLPWRQAPIVLAAIGTLLVGLGVVLSPGAVEAAWLVAANRALSVLALWAAAVLAFLQRRAQARLQDSEARLGSVFETAPDGIVVIDERGTIVSFNPASERLFGHRAEEAIGSPLGLLMPESDASRHDQYLRRYLETGERRIIGIGREVLAESCDGGTFPAELAVDEFLVDGRRMFTGFIRDLSARREAEARARRAQAELHHVARLSEMGEMASVLAHNLKQPLTASLNYLHASRRTLEAGAAEATERAGALLKNAHAQVGRTAAIVDRLRDFLRADQGERRLEDVNEVVREACELALMGASVRGIEVALELGGDLPRVPVDRIQLQQVLVNLLRNAVDALEDAGRRRIEVRTRASGNAVEIAVADTGPGVPGDLEERLYQPFASSKPAGMGIGLPISRGIGEAHGGRLWHERAADTTVFRFTLPTAPDIARAAS